MAKLSVVIITKNEEKNIQACLETVKWADEIVIVDSLSTDKTIEIAKRYTNKIFTRLFTNYSDQRNFADRQASHRWILAMDADERVTPELKAEIEQAVEQSNHNGYWIPCLDYMFGKLIRHGGWYPQYHLRLYRKDAAKWVGTVHEKIILSGEAGYLKNPLLHYSHLTISNFIQKLDRYTSLEVEHLYAQGERTNVLKMLFWPLIVFIYKYFYRLGFLDGVHGLVLASSLAYYHFIKHAKLWEKWYKAKIYGTEPKSVKKIDGQ